MSVKDGKLLLLVTIQSWSHDPPAADSHLTDSFPSSAAFDAINSALSNEADRKDAIKQGAGIYAFTLTNSAGKEASWHIDLKNEGKVGKGLPAKADGMFFLIRNLWLIVSTQSERDANINSVTLVLSDDDFASLVSGKANAQRLFMGGKLKIKGNIMKATKLDPILKKSQTKAKL